MLEFLQYLGKFHPVILHLPIGALYFTFFLSVSEKVIKENFLYPIRIGLGFSFVFAVISCFLGYFLSLSGDYGEETLNIHMWLGISTAVFTGSLLWIHKKGIYKKHFIPFFGFTIVLLTITGHYGGSMTHGEGFLNLPEAKNKITFYQKDSLNLYTEVIRPILDNKCVKCHNPSKTKGELLLTSEQNILKGGKSGNILVANNSLESHLYNYPNLPLEEDLHMPPKGNSQLKKHEIELIKYWIDSGASFDKLEQTMEMDLNLTKNLASFFPKPNLIAPLPNRNDLDKLQNLNFRLERNSNENNFIEAKFLGKELQSKHLKALLKIKNQLIKLDLSNTNLDDNLMSKLKNLENLKYLKLNDTEISDKGLVSINKSAESLNLNNTSVTYEGLVTFLENSNLKKAYLWNTNISIDNQKELNENYTTEFNFGAKNFAKGMPLSIPVLISEQTLFKDSLLIEIYKSIGNPKFRYTTNGDEPDSLSTLYTERVKINKTLTFKAKAFKKGWKSSKTLTVDYVKTGGLITEHQLKTGPDVRYKNVNRLFDGALGALDFRSGHWNGFIKNNEDSVDKMSSSGDLIVEINIPKKNPPNYIGIHALTSIPAYITFPKKIELFDISSGNEVLISSKVMPKPVANEIPEMKMYKMPLNKKNLDKVKLVITSNKKLPEGHPAEGEPAWLFVSEIIFLL